MSLASSGTNLPDCSVPRPPEGAAVSRSSNNPLSALPLLPVLVSLAFLAACAPEEPSDADSAPQQQLESVDFHEIAAPAPADAAENASTAPTNSGAISNSFSRSKKETLVMHERSSAYSSFSSSYLR